MSVSLTEKGMGSGFTIYNQRGGASVSVSPNKEAVIFLPSE